MYYGVDKSTGYFCHRAKNGTMNSTTSAKGTDGKPNNSSTYNHEYYMRNKEKWAKKEYWSEGDSDFDESNYSDKNHIADSDFYSFKNKNGQTVLLLEDRKWTLPDGMEMTDELKKKLAGVQGGPGIEDRVKQLLGTKSSEKEFDVDAAARDVIRGKYKNGAERKAALGDDYAVVQKRVNEMMKAKHSDEDGEVLEHHGILGQKWGVRRFQKLDGTRTAAGKAREKGESSNNVQNGGTKQGINSSKVKKAVAIGAGVAVGAALIAHPTTRAVLTKYGKTAMSNLPGTAAKVGSAVGKGAAKLVNKTESRASKLGDAMIDAALASAGGIAISKLSEKMAPKENASESEKNTKKVAFDAASAGIRTMTNSSGGNSSNGSNAKVDKSSKEYQSLFNGLESDSDRKKIKERANEGASMEELQKLRDEMGHSDIQDWIDSIIYDPARW